MKTLVRALMIGGSMVVAGCGQKGPLYLPDKNASVVTRPGGASTATPAQPTPGATTPSLPAPGATSPQLPPQGAAPQPPPLPSTQGTTTSPDRPKDRDKNDSEAAPNSPP